MDYSKITNALKALKNQYINNLGNKSLMDSYFALTQPVFTANKLDTIESIEAHNILSKAFAKCSFQSLHNECFHPEPYLFWHCPKLSPQELNIVFDKAIEMANHAANQMQGV